VDEFQKCIAKAILGGAYLMAATIMFVGACLIISFLPDVSPKIFMCISGLTVVAGFFYIAGFISLIAAAKVLK